MVGRTIHQEERRQGGLARTREDRRQSEYLKRRVSGWRLPLLVPHRSVEPAPARCKTNHRNLKLGLLVPTIKNRKGRNPSKLFALYCQHILATYVEGSSSSFGRVSLRSGQGAWTSDVIGFLSSTMWGASVPKRSHLADFFPGRKTLQKLLPRSSHTRSRSTCGVPSAGTYLRTKLHPHI